MKKIIQSAFFLMMSFFSQAQMTITITAPSYTPILDNLYMAGTMNNWSEMSASHQFTRQTNGSFTLTLSGITNGTALSYKITRGSWATVETNASGGDVSNRTLTFQNGGAATISIANWHDFGFGEATHTISANVQVLDSDMLMPQLGGRTRRIWVYLPTDYTTNTAQRYPVVYMHDAQNLFDVATSFSGEWGIDEAMNSLAITDPNLTKAIIVGIDNGGASRIDEYCYWTNPTYGGGEGDEYMAFLVNTLKPTIDQRYRTLTDRANTALIGSSLGGLISYYGALEYQNIIGKAGVFSPSFWFSNQIIPWTQAKGKQQSMRLYFVCGDSESSGMVPDMNNVYSSLQGIGFSEPNELKKKVVSGGQHSEWFWRQEFPDAYRWLFASSPSPTLSIPVRGIALSTAPNPTTDITQLTTSVPAGTSVLVQVFNPQNQLISQFTTTQNPIPINLTNQIRGVYYVRVIANNRIAGMRISKI